MRKRNILPKRKEIVSIPKNLLAFLKEVYERIERNDEFAMTPSDDLLQTEFVYGGKYEDKDEWMFSYFPVPGTSKHKWYFDLDRHTLKNIHDGKVSSLEMWACQYNNCRSKSMDKNESCFYCDYTNE